MESCAGDDKRMTMKDIEAVRIEKHLCDFCFDAATEFRDWSGLDFFSKETAIEKRKEFWEYATRELNKNCCIYNDGETYMAICIYCLSELIEKYSKETGEGVWISQSGK